MRCWVTGFARPYGEAAGIGGAALGFVLLLFGARGLLLLALRSAGGRLRGHGTARLHELLENVDWTTAPSNLVLLELSSRRAIEASDLCTIRKMLCSHDTSVRGFGWAALTSVFPAVARQISYSVNHPPQAGECLDSLDALIEGWQGGPPKAR